VREPIALAHEDVVRPDDLSTAIVRERARYAACGSK
jgi:hypothetical protein